MIPVGNPRWRSRARRGVQNPRGSRTLQIVDTEHDGVAEAQVVMDRLSPGVSPRSAGSFRRLRSGGHDPVGLPETCPRKFVPFPGRKALERRGRDSEPLVLGLRLPRGRGPTCPDPSAVPAPPTPYRRTAFETVSRPIPKETSSALAPTLVWLWECSWDYHHHRQRRHRGPAVPCPQPVERSGTWGYVWAVKAYQGDDCGLFLGEREPLPA